jgi:hypothetical protein
MEGFRERKKAMSSATFSRVWKSKPQIQAPTVAIPRRLVVPQKSHP